MKKLIVAVGVLSLFASAVVAVDTWTGTRIGSAVIDDGITEGIAIHDGGTNGPAHVMANGAGQIGHGSNTVANTLKYRAQYVVLSATNSTVGSFDPAQMTANGTFPPNEAFGGNLSVTSNLVVGGSLTTTGAVVTSSTARFGGNTTVGSGGNFIVGGTSALTGTVTMTGAATVGGTLGVTGKASFTAVPEFDAAAGTPGAVTFVVTNAPTGASTIPKWLQIKDANGYTNYFMVLQF